MKTFTWFAVTTTLVASHCLGIGSAIAAGGGSEEITGQRGGNPVEKAVGDVEADYRQADVQHEDIIDRAFAPLDDTVSDINRDLNDKAGDGAILHTDE